MNETLRALLVASFEGDQRALEIDQFKTTAKRALLNSTADELANIFVLSSFLSGVCTSLDEKAWNLRETEGAFTNFLDGTLTRELSPLAFLGDSLRREPRKQLSKKANLIALTVSEIVRMQPADPLFQMFIRATMNEMDKLTRYESRYQTESEWFANSLYRAFDEMDRILGVDYAHDKNMKTDLNMKERLYEGAGIGVQTSYISVLLALEAIQPASGSSFIDLGSGYGRVGFVIGLLRPDMDFIGYEYVEHRVTHSQACADRAGLSEKVRFITQDLSARDFAIPVADVYYMYDPFSRETYEHVFAQLKKIGRERAITVVTKGRASGWFAETIRGEKWATEPMCDEGTLGIFKSA